MTYSATSRGGGVIRLTAERWSHTVEEHSELAGLREEVVETVSDAEEVFAGREGELLALRHLARRKTLVVVYRETDDADGFIITAFLATRLTAIRRRTRIWPPRT